MAVKPRASNLLPLFEGKKAPAKPTPVRITPAPPDDPGKSARQRLSNKKRLAMYKHEIKVNKYLTYESQYFRM